MEANDLRDQLREIAATGSIDASAARGEIEHRARMRRRNRRRTATLPLALALVCGLAVLVVTLAGGGDSPSVRVPPAHSSGQITVGPTSEPGALQIRPVLASVPTFSPVGPFAQPDLAQEALASCDVSQVLAFASAMPTTPVNAVTPQNCVVLEGPDGTRSMLGPSKLDGTEVTQVTRSFQSGKGWGVNLRLTTTGSQAFDALARQQFHQEVAIVVNGKVVAEPTIQPNNAAFTSFGGDVHVSFGDNEAAVDDFIRTVGGAR
jgi:hypothetical protein